VIHAIRAPSASENYEALARRFPGPPASADLAGTDGFGALTKDAFLNDFANGVEQACAVAQRGAVAATRHKAVRHHPPE
jgi:hypothetical protein